VLRNCSQTQQLQPQHVPVRAQGFPRKMKGSPGHTDTAMALQQHFKGCCYEKGGTHHTGVPAPQGALGCILGGQMHQEEQSKAAMESWLQQKLSGLPGMLTETAMASPGTGAGHSGKHPSSPCQCLLPVRSHCHLIVRAGTGPSPSLCDTTQWPRQPRGPPCHYGSRGCAAQAPAPWQGSAPGWIRGQLLLSHWGKEGERTAPGMPALLCRDEAR